MTLKQLRSIEPLVRFQKKRAPSREKGSGRAGGGRGTQIRRGGAGGGLGVRIAALGRPCPGANVSGLLRAKTSVVAPLSMVTAFVSKARWCPTAQQRWSAGLGEGVWLSEPWQVGTFLGASERAKVDRVAVLIAPRSSKMR